MRRPAPERATMPTRGQTGACIDQISHSFVVKLLDRGNICEDWGNRSCHRVLIVSEKFPGLGKSSSESNSKHAQGTASPPGIPSKADWTRASLETAKGNTTPGSKGRPGGKETRLAPEPWVTVSVHIHTILYNGQGGDGG